MLRVASMGGFFGQSGFLKLARVDSSEESTWPGAMPRKVLILSQKSLQIDRGGFQVDSPVKKPVASEMPRSAPPYTDRAQEEPWEGGGRQTRPTSAVHRI